MTDKVTSLYGDQISTGEPVQSCVNTLRKVFEQAEAGEVVGVALVCLYRDGAGGYHVAGRVGGYSMLGAMEAARADLLDVVRGED
jgi:hypothetical protein